MATGKTTAVVSALFLLMLLLINVRRGQARPMSTLEDGIVLCYDQTNATKVKAELQRYVQGWLNETTVNMSCQTAGTDIRSANKMNSYCPEMPGASEINMTQEPPVIGHSRCVCEGENLPHWGSDWKAPNGSRCVQRSRLEPVLRQGKLLNNGDNRYCAKGHGEPYVYHLEMVRVDYACEFQVPNAGSN